MKKYLNKALLCFILVFIFLKTENVKAQNEVSKKEKNKTEKYLKVYLETSYESKMTTKKDNNYTNITQLKRFKVYPSFAFSKIKTNGRFFEMSFALKEMAYSDDISQIIPNNLPNTSVPERGSTSYDLAMASRFEWAWRLNQAVKHSFYVGVSGNPIFSYSNIVPYTTASFPSYKYALTAGLSVVPRWCYHLSDKLLIDVNTPMTFLQSEINYAHIGDPSLPTFARNTKQAFANFVFKPQFRIGFGVRI
jgi:hypothetical protein